MQQCTYYLVILGEALIIIFEFLVKCSKHSPGIPFIKYISIFFLFMVQNGFLAADTTASDV